MNKSDTNKNLLIEKLKQGSKWIAVLCILAALVNLAAAVMRIISVKVYAHQSIAEYTIIRQCITYVLSAVIMAIAAVLFFRIAKEGIPFTVQNVRAVRFIGILFLLNALIPSVAAAGMSEHYTSFLDLSNPSAFIEGLLFLFIAHIIRYGAMLQQESDETL